MSLQNSIGYPDYCVGYNGYVSYSGVRPQPGKVGYGEWRDTVSDEKYRREGISDVLKTDQYKSVYRKDMDYPPKDYRPRPMINESSKVDKTGIRREQALKNGIPNQVSIMHNDYRLTIPVRTAPAVLDGSQTSRGRIEGAARAAAAAPPAATAAETAKSQEFKSLHPLVTPRFTKPSTAEVKSPKQPKAIVIGSRIFSGVKSRSSHTIDFGNYKHNPLSIAKVMTPREYTSSTVDLAEGTPKEPNGHIPGYTGFLPISRMNNEALKHAAAESPRRTPFQKACNLRGNYRHNIPGYGGFQPDAERNDKGPVQMTTRTQTGENHRWNAQDAGNSYIKPRQKNANKSSTILTCSQGTNQRLLSQTGRLVAPGASTYDF